MHKHASRTYPAYGKRQIFFIMILQLFFWAAILPALAQETMPVPETAADAGETHLSSPEEDSPGEPVIASYYGKRFKGRKTGSGEIYDPSKLTAAHPTLPFGTRVKVVNPANNRSVIVTINDRCYRREVPFIDLSLQAARDLGIIRQGKAALRMIELEEEDNDDEAFPAPEQPARREIETESESGKTGH